MDPNTIKIRGTVTQHRSGIVGGVFMIVPRETVEVLEQALATAAGVSPVNHAVYALNQNGSTTYIKIIDNDVHLGTSWVEELY